MRLCVHTLREPLLTVDTVRTDIILKVGINKRKRSHLHGSVTEQRDQVTQL